MSTKKCLTRVSHKSVKQECLTRTSRNSVKQGCPTRVPPQCVKSGCLTSEFVGNVTNKYCLCLSTYVSAFGFVGFILFFFFFFAAEEKTEELVLGDSNNLDVDSFTHALSKCPSLRPS